MFAILLHPRVLIVIGLLFALALLTRLWRQRQAAIATAMPDHPPVPIELLAEGLRTWVLFTTPMCPPCGQVADLLSRRDPATPIVRVDATERSDLARQFEIRSAPTLLLAGPDGGVVERLVGVEAVQRHLVG